MLVATAYMEEAGGRFDWLVAMDAGNRDRRQRQRQNSKAEWQRHAGSRAFIRLLPEERRRAIRHAGDSATCGAWTTTAGNRGRWPDTTFRRFYR